MDTIELTVREAAELTGYSGRQIRRLALEGTIKARMIGNIAYLIDKESLLIYTKRMDLLGTEKHANTR